MDYAKTIQKLEAKIAKIKAKSAQQNGKRFLALAKQYGHQTIDEFIKALAPYASPVMKGKLGAKKGEAAAPAKVAAPASGKKGKRTRAKIDDAKRNAVIADIKAAKMTAIEISAKHGVSVPSVNNIKKAAGLVKKR